MAQDKITYPVVVTLDSPVEHGKETIFELHLNRPKAKHLRGADLANLSFDTMLDLLGKLSGQPPSVIDELDMDDMAKAFDALGKCLPTSPTI